MPDDETGQLSPKCRIQGQNTAGPLHAPDHFLLDPAVPERQPLIRPCRGDRLGKVNPPSHEFQNALVDSRNIIAKRFDPFGVYPCFLLTCQDNLPSVAMISGLPDEPGTHQDIPVKTSLSRHPCQDIPVKIGSQPLHVARKTYPFFRAAMRIRISRFLSVLDTWAIQQVKPSRTGSQRWTRPWTRPSSQESIIKTTLVNSRCDMKSGPEQIQSSVALWRHVLTRILHETPGENGSESVWQGETRFRPQAYSLQYVEDRKRRFNAARGAQILLQPVFHEVSGLDSRKCQTPRVPQQSWGFPLKMKSGETTLPPQEAYLDAALLSDSRRYFVIVKEKVFEMDLMPEGSPCFKVKNAL